MTADDGAYRVPELAVGRYEVKAERTGFKTETRKGITLEVTEQAVVNFTLEVGSTSQQVVVTEEASVVNTQDATLGGLVNEQSVKDLPLNGRSYVDLALLQRGVNEDRNGAKRGHNVQRQRGLAAVQQFHARRGRHDDPGRSQPLQRR